MSEVSTLEKRKAAAAYHALKGGWTVERVDRLKVLVAQGDSFAQIARALGGVTRNACIGKALRLGLSKPAAPSKPIVKVRAPKPKARPKPAAPKPPVIAGGGQPVPVAKPSPAPTAPRIAFANPRPLAALDRRQCRTPANDGQDPDHGWLYCGEPTDGGQYCARCRPAMVDRARTRDSNRHMGRIARSVR